MERVLLVLLGGAFGTGLRYSLSLAIHPHINGSPFPYATLLVNLSGCLAIGVLAELFEARVLVSPNVRVALLTGVLGGYTTFSSFGFDTFHMIREGRIGLAAVNVSASVVLGLTAVWAGMRLGRLL
ncbi:MAG TPA: fluoride efflux transporter CrcB [Blastocatellia bacterium]|jgi:CrcB protein|nr:fluoride efflux transporter CrcB [Blastocatellia bacterium]